MSCSSSSLQTAWAKVQELTDPISARGSLDSRFIPKEDEDYNRTVQRVRVYRFARIDVRESERTNKWSINIGEFEAKSFIVSEIRCGTSNSQLTFYLQDKKGGMSSLSTLSNSKYYRTSFFQGSTSPQDNHVKCRMQLTRKISKDSYTQ